MLKRPIAICLESFLSKVFKHSFNRFFMQDPFQRLNALIAEHFPNGVPSDTINLHIGDPKGPTNQAVLEEYKKYVNFDRYPPLTTSDELKDAIIEYNQKVHGVTLQRDQVTAVHGTKSALAWMPNFFLNRGHGEIIVPDLSYATYVTAPDRLNVKINYYSVNDMFSGFLTSPRGINYGIINTPHNPYGVILSRKELETSVAITQINQGKNFILASDECYINIFNGKRPTSLLQVDKTGEFKNMFVTNSLSKLGVPGLRSGYVAGDSFLVQRFESQYRTTGNAREIAWHKASALAWRDFKSMEETNERYQEALRDFSQQTGWPVPPGAFYFFPKAIRDGEEVAVDLLRHHNIKVMPGKYLDYAESGRWDNYIRIPVAEKLPRQVIGAIKDAVTY